MNTVRRLITSSDWQFVAAAAILFALLQVTGFQIFRYQVNWIESLEPWRLISGHLVHVGWVHLLINTLGLFVLVALIQPGWSLWRWCVYCLVLGLGISAFFTVLQPQLDWYAGFSGVLFGLYLLGAFTLCKRDQWISTVIIALISLKLITEQMGFDQLNSAGLIGAPVIVDAHLYGSIVAIVIELVTVTMIRTFSSTQGHEENG